MKTLFFRIIVLLLTTHCFSQNFQGIAYYSSQTQLKDFNISSDNITPEIKEQMMEKMKKAFEKTFILEFTNLESIYQEEKKLETPKPSSGGVRVETVFGGGSDSKFYKDFKKKQFVTNKDLFGKEFLVIDSLEQFNWIMTNEQKKIGNYTCYKAQITIPVTEKDIEEYENFKKKKEDGKTQLFSITEPKDQVIEAWYTLDIPVSNGPGKYWGLPGLILELHESNTTYLCSKIVLNTNEKIEIKAPKSGKIVTQKEFDKIQEKKLKSMMNDNGVIEIKMN
ncbi:GLPGLI family protein [Flavobacterium sp. U410]|jgi:GLPGLI family protein